MKKVLLLLAIVSVFTLQAQEQLVPATGNNMGKQINRLSVRVSMATPVYSFSELNKISTSSLKNLGIGEINISYKVNSRLSVGISAMGDLVSNKVRYLDPEGQSHTLCYDDEMDDDDLYDDDLDDMDLYDDDMDDDDLYDDDCDDDDDDLDALLGSLTLKLSEQLPFFIQAASGYSFSDKALAYSTMIGYNQQIFSGLGISAGVRYADALRRKPLNAVRTTGTDGLRLDVGLNWNF